uniref:Uncharacterized protein n=1 Tax=Vitrella brassicaformis TaxID=1169539 RepID=A0A7S1JT53_9ALVE
MRSVPWLVALKRKQTDGRGPAKKDPAIQPSAARQQRSSSSSSKHFCLSFSCTPHTHRQTIERGVCMSSPRSHQRQMSVSQIKDDPREPTDTERDRERERERDE